LHERHGMRLRPFAEGAGFATLYTLPAASTFLTPSLGDSYHHLYPLTSVAGAILLVLLLLWVIASSALFLLERLASKWQDALWIPPLAIFIVLIGRIGRNLLRWPRIMSAAVAAKVIAPGLVTILAGVLLLLAPAAFLWVNRRLRLLYAAAGCGLLILVPQLTALCLRGGVREIAHFEHGNLPNAANQPRILWLLMDELSYAQALEHPAPGIVLPQLGALAKQSVVYSAVQPVGVATEKILPSLMLGTPVIQLSAPYQQRMRFRSTPEGEWQDFDEYRTIFADAHGTGWSTGVVGWYNPYCRLLPHVLDRCSWQPEIESGEFAHGLSSKNSTAQNVLELLPRFSLHAIKAEPVAPHLNTYQAIMALALDAMDDQQIRFLFLHLPVPHPPGIYDRRRHMFAAGGNYLDNLVLADDTLGTILDRLRADGHSRDTTIVLTSDHSWRVWSWKNQPGWTAEEQQVGKEDARPVLLVHFPGQTQSKIISQPESALLVHTILEGLVRRRLSTVPDLSALSRESVTEGAESKSSSALRNPVSQ
jgi:hypothetical protein